MHRSVFFFEVIPCIFTYTSSCFPILPTWFKSYWIGDIWSPKKVAIPSPFPKVSQEDSREIRMIIHFMKEFQPSPSFSVVFVYRLMALYTQLLHRALVMWYLPIFFHIPSNVQVAKCFSTPLWKRKFDVETSTPCFKTVGNVLLWHLGVGGNGETERVLFLLMKLWNFPLFHCQFFSSRMECNNLGDHKKKTPSTPLRKQNWTIKKNIEQTPPPKKEMGFWWKKTTAAPSASAKKIEKNNRDVLESRISSCASQLEIKPGSGALGRKLRSHNLEDHPSYTPEN